MISIIIPTLNEAARLPRLLANLERSRETYELIISDGGSNDGTQDIARNAGATVVEGARGRGAQLVAGISAAHGDLLWFLHADTEIGVGDPIAKIVERLGEDRGVEAGNFRLTFDGDTDFCRWLDGFYETLRARGLYYGDSAIFVRRDVLDEIGGVAPLALMEDYDLVRRLEMRGRTIQISEPSLTTSARRFEGRSKPAIIAGWVMIHLMYHVGISSKLLAWLYDSTRRRKARRLSNRHRTTSFSPQS